MKNYLFALIGLIGLLSSCSPRLTPFTEELNDTYRWSEADLQKIQFYLSNDIVLYREYGNDESTIRNGKIKIKDDKEVERIIFKRGTKGALIFTPKYNRFAISFEEDGSNRYLMFGPSEKANGRFVLLAKSWKRNTGKVTYDNAVYSTPSASAFASLLVDLKSARKLKFRTDRVRGRKVN